MASEANLCVIKMISRARNPPRVGQNLVLQGHGVVVEHGLERLGIKCLEVVCKGVLWAFKNTGPSVCVMWSLSLTVCLL